MYDHSHKIVYVCMGCYHSITYAYISSVGEVRGNIHIYIWLVFMYVYIILVTSIFNICFLLIWVCTRGTH